MPINVTLKTLWLNIHIVTSVPMLILLSKNLLTFKEMGRELVRIQVKVSENNLPEKNLREFPSWTVFLIC